MVLINSFSDLTEFQDQIRACECSDGMTLYHYKSIDENSNPILKQVRGLIFENETGKLLMGGFPYTPEYTYDTPNLQAIFGGLDKYRITFSFEGTVVRVFYYKDKWRVATTKKLDARNSYWAMRNVSFEDLFRSAIDHTIQNPNGILKHYMQQKGLNSFSYDTFFESLEKDRQYMFLIRPLGENRIVSFFDPTIPVLHVGTFINHSYTLDDYIGIPKPCEMPEIKSVEDLTTVVAGLDPYYAQGVLLIGENTFFKVISKRYAYLYSLRGNEANLEYRYLEVKKNDPNLLPDFLTLYPMCFGYNLTNIDIRLEKLAKIIFDSYMNRFVHKKYVVLPQCMFHFMVKVHHNFLKTKTQTTLETVQTMLKEEETKNVYNMLSQNFDSCFSM